MSTIKITLVLSALMYLGYSTCLTTDVFFVNDTPYDLRVSIVTADNAGNAIDSKYWKVDQAYLNSLGKDGEATVDATGHTVTIKPRAHAPILHVERINFPQEYIIHVDFEWANVGEPICGGILCPDSRPYVADLTVTPPTPISLGGMEILAYIAGGKNFFGLMGIYYSTLGVTYIATFTVKPGATLETWTMTYGAYALNEPGKLNEVIYSFTDKEVVS